MAARTRGWSTPITTTASQRSAQADEVIREHLCGEHVGALDHRRGALFGQPRRHRLHLLVDHVDEGVGARGKHEHQPRLALARQARRGRVGSVAEPFDDRLDVLDGARAHAAAPVQHPVHGGEADARRTGHVMQAGASDFGHPANHTGAH